jgi:hypothetical protein
MKHHIHPTARDLEIFRQVGQLGASTTTAIHREFWAGRQLQTAQDRLDQLTKAGYLKHQVLTVQGQAQHVYSLGRQAVALFSEVERRGFLLKPAPGELAHLLRTGEVLAHLRATHQVSGFVHEHGVRSAVRRGASQGLADGQVTLDGTAVLLEIDSPHYTGQRLREKVAALSQASHPVLWVVASQARLETVSRAAANTPNIEVLRC